MITEYCCFGDLLNFLRRKRESFTCFKLEEDCYYRNVVPQRHTTGSGSFLCVKTGFLCVEEKRDLVLVFTIQNVRRRGIFGQQCAYVWLCSAETRLLLSSSQWQLERLHGHEAFCCWKSALQLFLWEEALTTQRQASQPLTKFLSLKIHRKAAQVLLMPFQKNDHPCLVCPFRWLLYRRRFREWDVWRGRSVSWYRRPSQLLIPSGQRHGVLSFQKCENQITTIMHKTLIVSTNVKGAAWIMFPQLVNRSKTHTGSSVEKCIRHRGEILRPSSRISVTGCVLRIQMWKLSTKLH